MPHQMPRRPGLASLLCYALVYSLWHQSQSSLHHFFENVTLLSPADSSFMSFSSQKQVLMPFFFDAGARQFKQLPYYLLN